MILKISEIDVPLLEHLLDEMDGTPTMMAGCLGNEERSEQCECLHDCPLKVFVRTAEQSTIQCLARASSPLEVFLNMLLIGFEIGVFYERVTSLKNSLTTTPQKD